MPIQYSGGTLTHRTFTSDGTKQQMVDQWSSACIASGWSAISGLGTLDCILETPLTAASNSIRVRVRDPGGGAVSLLFTIISIDGSVQGPVIGTRKCYIFPQAATLWRVIANPYTFYLYRAGVPTTSRAFVCGGTVWVPSWISSMQTNNEIGFIVGQGTSDADTATLTSWRKCIGLIFIAGEGGYGSAGFFNNFMADNIQGFCNLVVPVDHRSVTNTFGQTPGGWRWEDLSAQVTDPIIFWPSDASGQDTKHKGQLYDAMIVTQRYPADQIIGVDGKRWINISAAEAGGQLNASLFALVP